MRFTSNTHLKINNQKIELKGHKIMIGYEDHERAEREREIRRTEMDRRAFHSLRSAYKPYSDKGYVDHSKSRRDLDKHFSGGW